MELQKKYIMIGAWILLLIVVGFAFVYQNKKVKKVETNTEENASTTIVELGDGVTAAIPKGYTLEKLPETTQTSVPKPIPPLSRQVVFQANIDAAVKTTIQTKVAELQASLLKNPKQFNAWIDMGVYHKVAGDYEGAKIYWDYAGKLAPTDFISFGNLGNMYAYQLKDMVKAEQYYNQAIKNAPTQIYLYFQLAEAFRDVSKDIPRAKAVVERGLVANPGNTELLALRDSLK